MTPEYIAQTLAQLEAQHEALLLDLETVRAQRRALLAAAKKLESKAKE